MIFQVGVWKFRPAAHAHPGFPNWPATKLALFAL